MGRWVTEGRYALPSTLLSTIPKPGIPRRINVALERGRADSTGAVELGVAASPFDMG
jgi:hypothetical protein